MSEAVIEPTVETGESPSELQGDGLFSDNSSEGVQVEPEDTQDQPEVQEQETPAPDPDETGDRLRQKDYTQKTMALAEEKRAHQNEREQWLRERETAIQQPQEYYDEVPPSQYTQQIQQALQSPTLTNEDRAGLNVLYTMSQDMEQQAAELADLRSFREQFEPQYQETAQTVQHLSDSQLTARTSAIQEEVTEAQEAFGEESVQLSGDFIHRNFGATNPATGKEFTISELVGLATGKTTEEASAAREKTRTNRNQAKHKASTPQSPSGNPRGTGKQSRAEAIAEIEADM
jgi:hypothetical protein